jgi:hypothetical protein
VNVPPVDRTVPVNLPPSPTGVPVELQDGIDPELIALQAPPQAQRLAALTLMAAAVVAAMGLVLALRGDMRYAMSSAQPADLGDVQQADPGHLVSNSFVRIEGVPTVARAVNFSRGMGATYRIFPLAGQRTVYVQMEATGSEAAYARSEFTGRLVTFGDLGGRYDELSQYMAKELKLPVTRESFVLLADEPPTSFTWTWIVGLLCATFVLLDLFFIVRWFKPLKWTQIAPTER